MISRPGFARDIVTTASELAISQVNSLAGVLFSPLLLGTLELLLCLNPSERDLCFCIPCGYLCCIRTFPYHARQFNISGIGWLGFG